MFYYNILKTMEKKEEFGDLYSNFYGFLADYLEPQNSNSGREASIFVLEAIKLIFIRKLNRHDKYRLLFNFCF